MGQVGHKEGPRLRLNSTDPFRTAIRSYELDASNVVLKVHVPRLTGRKRKRGSDGSFSQSQNVVGEELRENDAKKISKALYDNPGTYSFQIIGIVDKIHRFRGMLRSITNVCDIVPDDASTSGLSILARE